MISSGSKEYTSLLSSHVLPFILSNSVLKASYRFLSCRSSSNSAIQKSSPKNPLFSLNTLIRILTIRSLEALAFESILKSMTSFVPYFIDFSIVSIVCGSWILFLKKSRADLSYTVLFSSRYDNILIKCDLPEPKKPDTHTPVLSVGVCIAL